MYWSDPIYDDITISITSFPTVSVVDSFDICQGIQLQDPDSGDLGIDPIPFLVTGTTVTNAGNIQWIIESGQGTLQFDDTAEPVYTPSATDVGVDPVVLKVTVTGDGGCSSDTTTKTVLLNVQPAGLLDAGNDASVCADTTEYTFDTGATAAHVQNLFWTHNGTGSITSGQGTLTPTYEFGTEVLDEIEFTLTADALDPCANALTRSVKLKINQEPLATIDPVAVVCSDDVVNLSSTVTNYSSLEWSSSGTGTFVDNEIKNPVYTPSEDDKLNGVTLFLTAFAEAPCGNDVTKSIDITFSTAVVASAMSGNPDANNNYEDFICFDEDYPLNEATVEFSDNWSWTTTGTGTFSPSAESLNPVYIPSDQDRLNPGTITLTLTAEGRENCSSSSENIILTIHKLPQITTLTQKYITVLKKHHPRERPRIF